MLEQENQLLENQLAQLSALGFIRGRAELELGMAPAEIEFFSSSRQAVLDEADHLARLTQSLE